MELRRYYHLFRSQWWIVGLAALACSLSAYVVSTHVLKKTYTATAQYQVSIPAAQGQQLPSPAVVTATDAQLFTSFRVASDALKRLRLDPGLSPQRLQAAMSCSPSEFAETFTCKLSYADPVLAARLLNEVAKVAIRVNTENQTGQFKPLLTRVTARIAATQADLARAQGQLQRGPGRQQSPSAPISLVLASRIEADNTALNSLLLQQVQLQQLLAAQTNSIIPIDLARPPTDPSNPKPVRDTLLALLLGLMLGVGAVLVSDYLGDSPRSPEDVEAALGVPILASVRRTQHKAGDALELVANPRSEVAESYRVLRTNIQFANVDTAVRALLVTSAQAGDGKTTTAANIAVAFAEAGVRVILLDGDLRRPSVHRLFGLDNRIGLTSLLLGGEETDWSSIIRAGPVPKLCLLTTGPLPPNPSELLSSQRMHRIMEELRAQADLVIVDSPPLLAVADPVILARMTDAVVLVSDVGQAKMHLLKRAQEALNTVGGRIYGVVLNKVPSRKTGYYGRYYYTYGHAAGQDQPTPENAPVTRVSAKVGATAAGTERD